MMTSLHRQRTRLLANKLDDASRDLHSAFIWSDTFEGTQYWFAQAKHWRALAEQLREKGK